MTGFNPIKWYSLKDEQYLCANLVKPKIHHWKAEPKGEILMSTANSLHCIWPHRSTHTKKMQNKTTKGSQSLLTLPKADDLKGIG